MNEINDLIEDIKENGKSHIGKKYLLDYLEGADLSVIQAIKAYCYYCQGYYDDGPKDCESPHCPLRPYMPYSTLTASKIVRNKSGKGIVRVSPRKWLKRVNVLV